MLKSRVGPAIRLRGVRHNNLKNFDLDLPLKRLIVITGLSGSGKSSLAFDTLFAEGQRRYIETFSPYARQFLDRMDKPQVDSIEGIPPAIAVEQRNSVRTTRSTVGTMTEICDYMKMLWPHVARLHCRRCGRPVRKEPPQWIWEAISKTDASLGGQPALLTPTATLGEELLVTFDLPLTDKLSVADSLALVSKQGYQRLLINREPLRIEEAAARLSGVGTSLTVIQDRVRLSPSNRARFIEACEQAYHFGKGKLSIFEVSKGSAAACEPLRFSNRLHCAACDIEYRDASPALFSFNHPVGACPTCRGFGRVITIDYNLALPDRSKTLAQGVVKPWLSGQSAECQDDLMRICRARNVPTNVPFAKLDRKWQQLVIEGDPEYGKDGRHQWPQAWYGIKGYFRWLESKAYKMHVRVLLSRYRAYNRCPDCHGQRFQPEALLYKAETVGHDDAKRGKNGNAASLSLADFYQLPVRDALRFIEALARNKQRSINDPLSLALNEVRSRLGFLDQVGLGYLTLDRPTRSLSGGETERVSLTTCLGTRLVNTLFVLDEPSVGLHPCDTERLVSILQKLRDAGNTVVVVEHEACVMRAADQLIDLGPGHGASGGNIVFQGSYSDLLSSPESITGQYLSGQKRIDIPKRRNVSIGQTPVGVRPKARRFSAPSTSPEQIPSAADPSLNEVAPPYAVCASAAPALQIANATKHNLHEVEVALPLQRFVCITGVSGSGKTTLIREVLLPALSSRLGLQSVETKASDRLATDTAEETPEEGSSGERMAEVRLTGWEHLSRVLLVDQSILGKTPRSNPAVYIGAFDDIRELFAQSELAKQRGLSASAFSFNSNQGQCERCRGAGFEKIEMQFLSDVFIRCPDCGGRRYRSHILAVQISAQSAPWNSPPLRKLAPLSIAELLDATVDEAVGFLEAFPDSRPAQRAGAALKLLQDVGLGYLKLGQPINTLSGGESQRLKLVRHLVEAAPAPSHTGRLQNHRDSVRAPGPTLFLFDEPTTGLHFEDIKGLLKVFQRLVDAGHSVVVIEHNLEVLKSADWLIDLGPEAGDRGGQVVATGTPEQVAACHESQTGRALRGVLPDFAKSGPRQYTTFQRRTA